MLTTTSLRNKEIAMKCPRDPGHKTTRKQSGALVSGKLVTMDVHRWYCGECGGKEISVIKHEVAEEKRRLPK